MVMYFFLHIGRKKVCIKTSVKSKKVSVVSVKRLSCSFLIVFNNIYLYVNKGISVDTNKGREMQLL